MTAIIYNLAKHKLRNNQMSEILNDIVTKDPDLFYLEHKNELEKHVLSNAPYLSFEECLITFEGNPDDYPESPTERIEKLWKRSRSAACSAVMDIWIADNPTAYIDFAASGQRLGDYLAKKGVKVK